MLAKMTSKNQLTLPRSVTEQVGAAEYFDVEVHEGQIVLTPVRIQRGDAVRTKLAALGLGEADVRDAIAWARQTVQPEQLMVAEVQPAYGDARGRRAARAPARPKRRA